MQKSFRQLLMGKTNIQKIFNAGLSCQKPESFRLAQKLRPGDSATFGIVDVPVLDSSIWNVYIFQLVAFVRFVCALFEDSKHHHVVISANN